MSVRPTIRVLLVDDHSVVRIGLRYFLATSDDIAVVGEAGNGVEALELIGQLLPHVVLMDLMMPNMDGITAIRQVAQRYPSVRVIALTSFSQGELVQQALQAGAVGFLMKNVEGQDLIAAIQATYAGRNVLTPDAATALVMTVGQPSRPGADLSERELSVLQLLTAGWSNQEIAVQLEISRNTVRHHVQNILAKLDVANRTAAATLALRHGLVSNITTESPGDPAEH
jgi:NarL family two-component system response regulator LiaR